MNKVKVTIKKRGRIPYIGNGPVIKPIYISTEIYDTLVKMGYPVERVDTVVPFVNKLKVEETEEVNTEEEVLEEETTEEVELNEETTEEEKSEEKTTEEEVLEEETSEDEEVVAEVVMDDPNYSAEAYYTEEFLATKAICKSILDARKAEYANNASLAILKKLVLESNPEVEFE